MNWDAVGAAAELLGALGVIVTLVYLAAQIRQNSSLLRSQISIAMRESRSELTRILATDLEANRIFWSGLKSRSELSEEDRRRFDPLITLLSYSWEHEYELTGGVFIGNVDLVLRSQGFQEWWQEYGTGYSEGFRAFIAERIGRGLTGR